MNLRTAVGNSETFLEIGCGMDPLPVIGDMRFASDSKYIGVDRNQEKIFGTWGAIDRFARFAVTDADAEFIVGDASDLAIQDGSVDEIFLGNVIGDSENSDAKQLINLLGKASSWLKPGRWIVFLETYTPMATHYSSFKFKNLLEGAGLEAPEIITPASRSWRNFTAPYSSLFHMFDPQPGSYMAKTKKV